MLAESRLVILSFVSPTPRLSDKENTLLKSTSRPRATPARWRCARTVSNLHLLSTAAYRRHARIRTSLSAFNNVHMETSSTPSSSQPRLTLPRHLARPKYRAIDHGVVTAIDSVLEDIPISYIQHSLKEIGPQLLQAACKATATPPAGKLPRELQLICNDVTIDPPTHILAAYASVDARVTLFPAHALILAASCAHLPALPPSKPDAHAESSDVITVPVVPLRIPSPATFPSLLSYLYTKRADHLMSELLPIEGSLSMDQLTQRHAASFPIRSIVDDARKVYGLWRNATALGIFDDQLFQTLEMTWEVLLGALAISSGQSIDAGFEIDAELE